MTQARSNPQDFPGYFPNASNESASREVHEERVFYREGVFYDGLVENFFDSWGDDQFYGKINTFGNAVYPLQQRLKPLRYSKSSEAFYAMGFVADAWRDFAEKMRELANNNIVHRDSPWAAPQIHKAYESCQSAYHSYMVDNVYPSFVENYLSDARNYNRVRDIGSFMNAFTEFSDAILYPNGSLTFSGFIEGLYSSVLNTGLAIEISGDDYDDDLNKAKKFKDANFELAAKIASQYGFSIDRNIPWRLVADISNPAMQEYMHGIPIANASFDNRNDLDDCDEVIPKDINLPDYYGFSQIEGFRRVKRHLNVYPSGDGFSYRPGYEEYQAIKNQTTNEKVFEIMFKVSYAETWTRDMEIIASYMLAFYNTYAQNFPVLSGHVQSIGDIPDCTTARRILFRRQPAPEDVFSQVNGQYRAKWALKSFYNSRKAERNSEKTIKDAKKDIQHILAVYDATSGSETAKYNQALRYAQEKFIGPYTVSGLTVESVSDIIVNSY